MSSPPSTLESPSVQRSVEDIALALAEMHDRNRVLCERVQEMSARIQAWKVERAVSPPAPVTPWPDPTWSPKPPGAPRPDRAA